MTTDYRALCLELLAHAQAAQAVAVGEGLWDGDEDDGLLARARTALAQPEHAEPPADGEVAELVALIRQIALAWEPDACLLGNMTASQLARAADLLEYMAQLAPATLKQRAMVALSRADKDVLTNPLTGEVVALRTILSKKQSETIRRALDALPDD
jgi:hypothetical protein